tara:strand:- start:2679 stop:4463 length:1785 start_codon:yes stop_codon:yes gene_type:complete
MLTNNLIKLSTINKKISPIFDFIGDKFQNLYLLVKFGIVGILTLIFILPGLSSIPPLDRDEARFSQASKQMLEDKNYVIIKFQEELRSKKPIGIYWLQIASASIFGKDNIISYRAPNIFSTIILIIVFSTFVYSISFRYFNLNISSSLTFSFFSSLVMATLLGLSIEIKQAKTDTVLLTLCTVQQLIFWKIYSYGKESWNKYKHHEYVWLTRLFWLIIALGILVKGPISPLLFTMTLLSICILDRFVEKEWNLSWLNLFLWFQGLLIVSIITLPWIYLAWQATDGHLILDAINKDFLIKLRSGQENHWGPFGSHLFLLLLTFWPMVLLLPFAARACLDWKHERLIRFLISWIIPFWIILELTPTKLPHYILPVFPGLILLILIGISSPPSGNIKFSKINKFFRAVVVIFTLLLALSLVYVSLNFSSKILIFILSIVLSFIMITSIIFGNIFFLNESKYKLSPLFGMLILAGICNIFVFSYIFPNLDKIHITPKIKNYIDSLEFRPDTIVATGYHEPSLIFSLGRDTLLLSPEEAALVLVEGDNTLAIVEDRTHAEVKKILNKFENKIVYLTSLDGFNLAKGQKIKIHIMKSREN